ncbi:MAG: efflux transporter outer membrane subunit [Verrucomicrobiaceae bacterium]|nr:MAG: efflux transporter outer membrane subunit [Verrucomicrobiaceae bacterium]
MKPARFFLISSVALAGLTGCGVTSSSQPDLKLPVSWKNAGGFPVASPDRDLSRWWGRFNDPTLNRVISISLESSPDVKTAIARVREARANRDAAYSSLFPSLTGGVSTNNRRNRTDNVGTSSSNSYSAGLDASWEVDLFGKNRSGVDTAAANLGAAGENLHSVHASLAAEVATVYTNLRTNEARLEVLKSNIRTREETSQLAGWRLKAGEADSLEATQAESSLESARASMPALQQSIAQGKNALALLAGRAPGGLDSVLASSNRGIPTPPSSLAVGIPADVLRQRPDVRLAGYQVLAAASATRSVEATRYPSLNLSGSLGLDTTRSSKLFDPEGAAASIAGGITSPIFDAGRIKANIEAASAAEEQNVENYRKIVLTALSETEDALIACRRSGERLQMLEKATSLARESDEVARQRYEAGEIDFLDVLDSQRTLLSLEDNLLSTRTDRTTAYIRLYQALGGGWSSGS